jgi:hypothetical protein
MLAYSPEVLEALLTQYNAAVWPAPLAAILLGLLALWPVLRPRRGGDRLLAAFLAAAWLWSGLVFQFLFMAPIDFVAPLFGLLFLIEGLLIAWFGLLRPKLAFRFHGNAEGFAGLGLTLFGLVGVPLLALALGRSPEALPILALTPTPTAIYSFGLLLLAVSSLSPGRALALLTVPWIWAFWSAVLAWMLHDLLGLLVLPAALLSTILIVRARRATPPAAG